MHEQMLGSSGQSDVTPPVLNAQASLVLIYRRTEGMKGLEFDHRGVADRCVTRQERQLHSILPPTSFFHRIIGGGDVSGSASRIDQAMDVLRTDHSAVKGIEWYAQTLNDVFQTQYAVLRFVM
ncbi:hypothetical protein TNCV_2467591 [Trichonephila clavipes]|nr:hypothetical protein TNCV_2467591 [Trichonephila clavipes]